MSAPARGSSQSAFLVRVPEAEPAVGAQRARHDPACALGVPAHVTLLFPFLPRAEISEQVFALARAIAARAQPFEFTLRGPRRFPDTLWLAPEPAQPFVELTLGLARAFPEFPPYGGRFAEIVPHLTVADGPLWPRAEVEAELARVLPAGGIRARAGAIELWEDSSGRWLPHASFALGAG